MIWYYFPHYVQVRGLEFNGFTPNLLASGADEGEICIWDIAKPSEPSHFPPLKVCNIWHLKSFLLAFLMQFFFINSSVTLAGPPLNQTQCKRDNRGKMIKLLVFFWGHSFKSNVKHDAPILKMLLHMYCVFKLICIVDCNSSSSSFPW